MKRIRKQDGQSLVEIMVGIALTIVFMVGIATVIAPALQIGKETTQAQTKTELASQLLDNVRAWAAGDWNNVLALATGTTNTYFLNTSSSPFIIGSNSSSSASSSPTYATISLVQATSSGDNFFFGAGTTTVTFGSSTTAGDTIIAAFGNSNNTPGTVSDTQGNTWTLATSTPCSGGACDYDVVDNSIYYATNILGGPDTVGVYYASAPVHNAIAILEYSGIAATNALDAVNGAIAGGVTSINTGNASLSQADELLFSSVSAYGNCPTPPTVSSGWTAETNSESSAGCVITADQEVSTPATYSNQFGGFASTDLDADIVTFKAATVTPGTGNSYPTSTESISIGGTIYNRYFYLTDVYRDSNGNATTTAASNSYDPSTKLISIVVNASTTNPGPAIKLSFYLTRNASNNFSQTSWAGGSGQNSPINIVGNSFYADAGISVTPTGSIQLSSGGNSCVL